MLIEGTEGPDLLVGTPEADTINGMGGNDVLRGLAGADFLDGGAGNDTLEGGDGADTLEGGDGADTADFSDATTPVLVEMHTEQDLLALGLIDRVSFPGLSAAPDRLVAIENVVTGAGNDTLQGDEFANHFIAGSGNDLLSGGLGIDTLDGGAGIDAISFYWEDHFTTEFEGGRVAWRIDPSAHSSVSMFGTGGSMQVFSNRDILDPASGYINETDQLFGIENAFTGMTNDGLFGSDGANLLSAGAGNDQLQGYGGSDTLLGGDGRDTLYGGGGTDHLDGGAGLDVANYRDTSARIRGDLTTGTVSFPDHTWQPEVLVSIEGISGGTGNDTLTGDGGANVLSGWDGNDTLRGGSGGDTLDGGYGTDLIDGGGGSDTASFQDVWQDVNIRLGAQLAHTLNSNGTTRETDTLVSIQNAIGGIGNDTLLGNAAANTLGGYTGDDQVFAREGNDRLLLSSGDDLLDGGTGIDTLLVDQKDLVSERYDFYYDAYEDGTTVGFLVLDQSNWASGPSNFVDLLTGIAWMEGGVYGASDLVGIENVEMLGAPGDDTVIGSEAANTITVGAGANYVTALGGNDIIYGGAHAPEAYAFPEFVIYDDNRSSSERLHGGAGNDTIYGSGTIYGGSGNDRLIATNFDQEVTLRGGSGADEFVFSGATENYLDPLPFDDSHMRGEIDDFSRAQGDRIVFEDVVGSGSTPVWVGQASEFETYEYGYYRRGNDLVIHYANGYQAWNPDDRDGPTITLVDYTGTIGASDILFT